MRKYKVINEFVERNEYGEITGQRPKPGEIVELPPAEAGRLIKANCVVEIEERTVKAPEDRAVRKRGRKRAGTRK